MQVFVRDHYTMIAAPVQRDVDGIPKGSHYVRVPIAIGRPNEKELSHRWQRRALLYSQLSTLNSQLSTLNSQHSTLISQPSTSSVQRPASGWLQRLVGRFIALWVDVSAKTGQPQSAAMEVTQLRCPCKHRHALARSKTSGLLCRADAIQVEDAA